jgi:hypothetical protein
VLVPRHARIAKRANQNRIERPQCVVPVGRHGDARLQEIISAPGELLEIEATAGAQHLQRFLDDLFPDPVAWNDRYFHDWRALRRN